MSLLHITTEDGSSTLYAPDFKEHYHSTHGAIAESMHIFLGEGFHVLRNFPARILEIGFGTGLNAFLTYLETLKEGKSVHYTCVEKYPLGIDTVELLNYPAKLNPAKAEIFSFMHNSEWNEEIKISGNFTLFKVKGDLLDFNFSGQAFNLVYFDAFSPDAQPELWTEEVFKNLYQCMDVGSNLVTYSCKGTVKRAMKAAGLSIEKRPGPRGKREITVASKVLKNEWEGI